MRGAVSAGRCIRCDLEPHQNSVLEAIRELGLELQIIFAIPPALLDALPRRKGGLRWHRESCGPVERAVVQKLDELRPHLARSLTGRGYTRVIQISPRPSIAAGRTITAGTAGEMTSNWATMDWY